jgi:hypothetical protein
VSHPASPFSNNTCPVCHESQRCRCPGPHPRTTNVCHRCERDGKARAQAEFTPIAATGSFASYASIGGRRIQNGDRLEVRWPDGTAETVSAEVRESTQPYWDHGHEYSMPVTTAYYTHQRHGIGVSAPLHGLLARFISPPDEER